MPHTIDLSEVYAAVEKYKKQSESLAVGNKQENVTARLQIEVGGPLMLWRAREANLNTDMNAIVHSMLLALAGSVACCIREALDDTGASPELYAQCALNTASMFTQLVLDSTTMPDADWNSFAGKVEPKESGRA